MAPASLRRKQRTNSLKLCLSPRRNMSVCVYVCDRVWVCKCVCERTLYMHNVCVRLCLCMCMHMCMLAWVCVRIYYPGAKKSLQPRNSWGWSTVRSCDIVQYRALVQHRRDPWPLRVVISCCRSKSMLHDITWSHCGSISWISQL